MQPTARRTNFSEKIHGINVQDPYRWMEKESEERTEWINSLE